MKAFVANFEHAKEGSSGEIPSIIPLVISFDSMLAWKEGR